MDHRNFAESWDSIELSWMELYWMELYWHKVALPAEALAGSWPSAVRRRCFVSDGERLIMPAMGAFTGGLNVLDEAYKPCFPSGGMMVFAMSREAVIPIASKRLIPDQGRPGAGRWRLNIQPSGKD